MKYRISHRLIALTLTLCMVLSICPAAFAAGEGTNTDTGTGTNTPPGALKAPGFSVKTVSKTFALNQLYSRGMMLGATMLTMVGKASGNEGFQQVTSFINKWVFGVSSGNAAQDAELAEISSMCQQILQKLDAMEQDITKQLTEVEKMLEEMESSQLFTDFNDAWYTQVEGHLEENKMDAVVDAYGQYLAAAKECGPDGSEAEKQQVIAKRELFFEKLTLMSGYNSTAGGSKDYYEKMMYATDDIDKKMASTLEQMLKELSRSDGTRYIDRAAQVAYLCYPTSSEQAAFVDQAVEQQSGRILMTMLAYQEFMAMRAEYFRQLQESGEALQIDGKTVSIEDLDVHFQNCQTRMNGMVDGSASTNGGLVGAMEVWLESPIYLENKVGSGWIYLDSYLRSVDVKKVELFNQTHLDRFSTEDYVAEARADRVAPMLDLYYKNAPDSISNVTSAPVFTKNEMTFLRNATILANDGGEAEVQVYYVLDPQLNDTHMEMKDLELVTTSPSGFDLHLPNCDYYSLVRGEFSDGYNTFKPPATAQDLKTIISDRVFTKCSKTPATYFADLLKHDSSKKLYLLVNSDTTYLSKYQMNVDNTFTGIPLMDMTVIQESFTDTWTNTMVDQKDILDTDRYALMLMGTADGQFFSRVAVTNHGCGTLSSTVDGHSDHRTRSGQLVAVTITPEDQTEVTGITIARSDGFGHTQTLDRDSVAALTDPETGVISLDLPVPYDGISIQVETHSYDEHGICANCDIYQPATLENGWYLIDNVGKLCWFSALVNGDTSRAEIPDRDHKVNGKITAALDFAGTGAQWRPIGTVARAYEGLFDGGRYPINGIDGMLFGTVDGATIYDVAIESGSFRQDDTYACAAGSIIGHATGTTNLERSYSKANADTGIQCDLGGLVGDFNGGSMMDCFYRGELKIYNVTGLDHTDPACIDVGGLVGNATALSTGRCYAAATFLRGDCIGGLFGRSNGGGSMTTFFNMDLYMGGDVGTALIPSSFHVRYDEDFASGEVAMELNGGRDEPLWKQDLGTMAYPEFTGSQVYQITTCQNTTICSNEPGPHVFGDDTICDLCGLSTTPAVLPEYPTLSFESEIRYNVYFKVKDLAVSPEDMGLLVFHEERTDGTYADADQVLPGAVNSEDLYMVSTAGIPAKEMGDVLYFKIYARQADGSYVYSDMIGYDAVTYAKSVLASSASEDMKRLVVSLLNYGAEAQKYFHHNEDDLMNSCLTAEQQALVSGYDRSMVADLTPVDSSKAGMFPNDAHGFDLRFSSVSFDGAFSINYYFITKMHPDDGMKFYYWDLATYESVETLTPENATSTMDMVATGTQDHFWANVPNIAAKQLDETVFVAGVYVSDGVTYTTGVLAYSLGKYCQTVASDDSSDQQALAQYTAVYGYYAKEYFTDLSSVPVG